MVEKEVTLKILADVDDSQVEDLENVLQQIVDGKITIPVETDSTELEEVESRIEELEQKRADIYMGMDDTELEEVEAELDELEARQIELTVDADSSGVDDVKSSVEDLESEIDNVNNTPISPPGDTSGVDNVSESVSGLNEALTAVGAGVSLAGMEQMVNTAGNINDSWNRLALTFGTVTDQMKTDISEAGEATGRSGGLIRSYFNDMGIAGIHNSELLQQSFEALSGRAYQTGNSIESMEQKMKMMVMSGNAGARQLTQLGLTTDDLGRVMGVTGEEASKMFKNLSQEDRLRVLTQAMGDGKQANEMYKNSWQGLKDQLDKAKGAFMGLVGNVILPYLVPAIQTVTQGVTMLSDAFKALPAPIQGIIGGVLALVMGFLAITTVISVLRTLESTLKLVTTAQQILNIVTAMNPYVLLAMAILVLIAALWYLYNTNQAVKQAFDHVGEALGRLWEKLSTALQPAIDAITQAWNGFMEALGISGGDIFDAVIFFIVAFAEGLVAIIDGITQFVGWAQQLWASFDQLVNGIDWMGWLQVLALVLTGPIGWIILLIQHWNQIGPAISNALSAMYQAAANWLNQTGARISSFASSIVSQLGSAAWNAVSSFASGISGLASALQGELDRMLSAAASWASQLIDRFWQAAVDAVNALKRGLGIGSPGFMYYMVEGEINRINDLAEHTDMPSSFNKLGMSMVDNFNPNLKIDGAILNLENSGSSSNMGNTGNNHPVTYNLNFNLYGDMDTEERMKKFLDYVTEYLDWDNNTAGRNMEVL